MRKYLVFDLFGVNTVYSISHECMLWTPSLISKYHVLNLTLINAVYYISQE